MKKLRSIVTFLFVTLMLIFSPYCTANDSTDIKKEAKNYKSKINVDLNTYLNEKIDSRFNKFELDNNKALNKTNKLSSDLSNNLKEDRTHVDNEINKINMRLDGIEKNNYESANYVSLAYKQVDWWFAALSLLLIIFSIVVPYLISLNVKEKSERKLEKAEAFAKESEENLNKIKKHAEEIESYYDVAKYNKNKLDDLLKDIEEREISEAQVKYSVEEEEVINGFAEDQNAPAKDRLTALGLKAYKSGEWDEALKYFSTLLDIEQNDPTIMFNLGYIYVMLAKKENIDSDLALKNIYKAKDLFFRVLECEPNNYVAYSNMGSLYLDLSNNEKDINISKKKEFLFEARKYCDKSIAINPNYYQARLNKGVALGRLAEIETDNEQFFKFADEGIESLKIAISFKPDSAGAHANISSLYYEIAERIDDKNVKLENLVQAKSEINISLSHDANNEKYINTSGVIDMQMSRYVDSGSEKYLNRAYQSFIQANNVFPGSGNYNLGCYYAIKNDEENSRYWLMKTLDYTFARKQIKCEHVKKDIDLDNVRDKDWFKDFVKLICDEQ